MLGASIIVTLVFGAASIFKISDIGYWRQAVDGRRYSPLFSRIVLLVIPGLEVATVLLALLPSTRGLGVSLGVFLLIGFSGEILVTRLRGLDADCGCLSRNPRLSDFAPSLIRNCLLVTLITALVLV